MKNAHVPLPGDIFAPAASRMYQMKISEVLWTHISVLSLIFQRLVMTILTFVRIINQLYSVVNTQIF